MSTEQTEPDAAHVAKLRKAGKTWDQVRAEVGLSWSDTRFRNLLRAAGKDAVIKPTGRKPKATAKKRTPAKSSTSRKATS